jgi:hypothetical protein
LWLTDRDTDDPTQVTPPLDQIDDPIGQVTADGALIYPAITRAFEGSYPLKQIFDIPIASAAGITRPISRAIEGIWSWVTLVASAPAICSTRGMQHSYGDLRHAGVGQK